MFKPYGYNCHHDPAHVGDEKHVGAEDVKNFINFAEAFNVEIPEELRKLMNDALTKTQADCHAAIHEAMDWFISQYVNNTAGLSTKAFCKMTFGSKEKAREKLEWMRSTCKL